MCQWSGTGRVEGGVKLGRVREVHSCQNTLKNAACTAFQGEQEPMWKWVYEREREGGCVCCYAAPVSVGPSSDSNTMVRTQLLFTCLSLFKNIMKELGTSEERCHFLHRGWCGDPNCSGADDDSRFVLWITGLCAVCVGKMQLNHHRQTANDKETGQFER